MAVLSLRWHSPPLSLLSFLLCPAYDGYTPSDAAAGVNAATSGLVGDFQFTCVPAVPAGVSMALVLLLLLPAIVLILLQPHHHDHSCSALEDGDKDRGCSAFTPVLQRGLFLKTVAYGAMTLFMFGYHVHEKAILVVLLPLTLLLQLAPPGESNDRRRDRDCERNRDRDRERERWSVVYLQVAGGGVVGVLPLLMRPQELILKGKILDCHSLCL